MSFLFIDEEKLKNLLVFNYGLKVMYEIEIEILTGGFRKYKNSLTNLTKINFKGT